MRKLPVAVTVAGCLWGGVGAAADLPVYEPAPAVEAGPAAYNWSGAYLGAQLGHSWAKDDETEENLQSGSVETDPDGFLGGVYAGYNWQFPSNLVLGAEADIAYTGIDGSAVNPAGTTFRQEWNWLGAVRGRVGYAFDRFLPYVAGGFAFGQVEASAATGGVAFYSKTATATGWTLGAGAEYAFSDDWIGRLEYRYTDFGRTNVGDIQTGDVSMHDIRVGISYKF